jgi:hypothetical protein
MIRVIAFLFLSLLAPAGARETRTRDTIDFACVELPSNSFPPNQLVREEAKDGSAVSVMKAAKPGDWAEFFVQIDKPGSYGLALTYTAGPDRGIFQPVVNGEALLTAHIDPYPYAATGEAVTQPHVGYVTFLKPGNYPFRFVATGKNKLSTGYAIALKKISLTPTTAFTLLSPNGCCVSKEGTMLRWNPWPEAMRYDVYLDGTMIADLDGTTRSFQVSHLSPGNHRWQVVAVEGGSGPVSAATEPFPSNTFSFTVGDPPPYPFREFSDDFSSGNLDEWSLTGMSLAKDAAEAGLLADGPGSAFVKDVQLDKAEGEISARVAPVDGNSVAGVGFQADDGTRLYAVLDGKRGQFRLERRVKGYSIFDVTPPADQVKGWSERPEGDALVWEIAEKPAPFRPNVSYEMKLAFSRRSACVMATLQPSDGSPGTIIRDLSDLRTPDHPLLVSLAGKTRFGAVAFRHLNKQVYKWDPDSFRIVLRPGGPGSWDEKGAFNPAVMVRDGTWYMIYRGNAVNAPPTGSPASELGLATSTDGVHWTKSPANPIIPRQGPKDSQEDPDFVWLKDKQAVGLENVTLLPKPREIMRSSSDWIHWSEPWVLNSGTTWGKIGGMLDLRDGPDHSGIVFQGITYPYVAMIEEGRIDLSQDLHTWVTAGRAGLVGRPDWWCNDHECSGDIFIDADHNIRYEAQAGVKNGGLAIVGNRLCTLVEGVLSGTDPTKVLWRSDLPWLPDWYGDAPTGSPEDFTAPNGSVFPGQTVIKDNWLWHFSGGNNTFTVLSKCWYGPLFDYRDLQAKTDTIHQCSVSVMVRNTGSLRGSGKAVLKLDGHPLLNKGVTLDRDAETILHWTFLLPAGQHTVSVDDVSESVAY